MRELASHTRTARPPLTPCLPSSLPRSFNVKNTINDEKLKPIASVGDAVRLVIELGGTAS